jgi:beta-lactamase class A
LATTTAQDNQTAGGRNDRQTGKTQGPRVAMIRIRITRLAMLAHPLAFVLLLGTLLSPAVHAAVTYDVSYLWHRDVQAVWSYRDRVARVLGPAVTKRLKVVAAGDKFGLVYARQGDRAGAVTAAQKHTDLLRASGLESAAAMRHGDWQEMHSSEQAVAAAAVLKSVEQTVQAKERPPGDGTDSIPALATGGKLTPAEKPKLAGELKTRAKPPRVQIVIRNARPAKPPKARRVSILEQAIEKHIKALRRSGKIAADERTGWSVYDFTTKEKLVSINEDVPFQAASLIKPFVAAAYMEAVERGRLRYGKRSKRFMERMIQVSDNSATNWVMRQVGGPRTVERTLKRRHPEVFKQTHIVEYIPANGRTYLNKASLHDYSRFLYALWNERIPGAVEMKRLMALPGPDRVVRQAKGLPSSTRVFNKTGSTGQLCGDMAILLVKDSSGREYPYTLIGVIEKASRAKNYTRWIRSRARIIGEVSDIVYESIARQHGLKHAL